MECDGFFDNEGIPFKPEFEDAAVRAVRAADFYDPQYKKWLIICWYDTTFGEWNGTRFDLKQSRARMADYLRSTDFDTYEQLLAAPDEAQ